jgi:signal peptide peptidase SppA
MKRADVLAVLGQEVWFTSRNGLDAIVAGLTGRIRDGFHGAEPGVDFVLGDIWADAPPALIKEMYAARGIGSRSGAVAIVPIIGPISRRDSWFTLFFGGTSVNGLIQQFRQLAADDTVATVVLRIDSPGGTVSGMPELAAEIRRLRESKTVIAVADDVAASAAYWIASQAEEIVVTPEGLVGSIGAYVMHTEFSKALEIEGITVTFVKAGERKVDGNEYEPLSDRAKAEIQGIVDNSFALFVADVATGRDVPAATVKGADWGEGAVLNPKPAKSVGMVDRIATFSETVARLAGAKSGSAAQAEAPFPDPIPEPEPPEPTALTNLRNRTAQWRVASL